MLSDENMKALKKVQSKRIAYETNSVSFSNVVNDALDKWRSLK
jgi:hypothetical protein